MTTHKTATLPNETATTKSDITLAAQEKKALIAETLADVQLEQAKKTLREIQGPNTNMDMFSKMLEMQQQTFNMISSMQASQAARDLAAVKANAALEVELEKLRLAKDGGDGEMSEIMQIMELLKENQLGQLGQLQGGGMGQLIGGDGSSSMQQQPPAQKQQPPAQQEAAQGENMDFNEFKQLIKSGEISFEEAYELFMENLPNMPAFIQRKAKGMTQQQFKQKFDAIKAGQL